MKRACVVCAKDFEPKVPKQVCCSDTCRSRKHRGQVAKMPARPADEPVGRTQHAVQAELEAAGRLETVLGAAAMALAERIDTSSAVMGFAPLVKELRSTMDAALAGVKVAEDPLDELRARRERKLDAS